MMSDDDFEDDDTLDVDLDDDESFDDFGKQERTLGDLWRENPAVKAGIIVAGGLLVLILFFVMGSGDPTPPAESYMSGGSDVTGTPGAEEVSPIYRDAIVEKNEAIAEEALQTGGSALPTPIDPPVNQVPLLSEPEKKEDPLQRWKKLQEERLEREMERKQEIVEDIPAPVIDQGPEQVNYEQNISDLAEAMADQMQAVLGNKKEIQVQTITLNAPDYIEREREAEEIAANNQGRGSGSNNASGPNANAPQKILFPAGQIAYSQLLIEANTDVPGPVLAQIVSGPLKGNRILGSFQETNELLTLRFNTIVINGKSQPINAIALDPGTSLPGMATDVDHRYFKRIILPMAASFVEGAAQAISDSGRTTVTIQGETVSESTAKANKEEQIASGIEEAGQELGSILDEMAANTRVMIKIAAGTPMGILFMESVLEDSQSSSNFNASNRSSVLNTGRVQIPNLNN